MAQLLDRYRRVSDGKEFAVVALGAFSVGTSSTTTRAMTLEAEDGERIESPAEKGRGMAGRGQGRFERIED